MVKEFTLIGLPEGMVGRSKIFASNIEELFMQYPILKEVREKIVISDNCLRALTPCDG